MRSQILPTPLRVMVVDDNQDAAGTLAGLLILCGHHARYFLDGATALAAASTFRPDVCLLDLRMPGMDGFDLAGRLRTTLGEDVKLVAVTGERRSDAEQRANESGFDLWFNKPADPHALLAALETLSVSKGRKGKSHLAHERPASH
jgi:CheY-like chemotaxis protein